MPTIFQRDALSTLPKNRLVELAQGFELELPTRSSKDEFIDALARSRRASYERILSALSRDELKAVCRAGGMDDSGKAKAAIAERILGTGDATGKPAKRGRTSRNAKDAGSSVEEATPEEEENDNDKLTLQKLESHLWGAANILRGSIDAADFKHYIFGLLFYKRLCNVWQEEYEQRLAEYDGDEEMAADPEEHRFDIPTGHSWEDVRKHSTNIGEHLNMAFHAIEDANFRMRGIFQDVDFNNKERFPDAVLERLLQHFEAYRLRNEDVEDDLLGNAYEYLIAKFADDAGKKGGEFYTHKMVVRLMVECLRPEEGMSIYDPTCGSGGMLLEAIDYLRRAGKNRRSLTLYGQERNLNTWAICKMNMFLHGIDDVFIERGDTLRDPKHLISEGSKALMTFDRVLANPPFSLKEWGHDDWSLGDKFGRDTFGCPPASYGDLAFVQHMVASLKPGGMLAVVLPHRVLFRGGSEGKIRQALLQADLIDAVIGLGGNLFYGTGIPACIWICKRTKPKTHEGKVLVINGSDEYMPGRNQNELSDANVARLASALHSYGTEDKFSAVVALPEIAANDFNLNISRYVNNGDNVEQLDVATEIKRLNALRMQRDAAESKMLGFLTELGYDDN
ncbi:MAG: class I SAM-dependent DNA methyltransferase [Nannocystaceae bacterium]